MVEMLERWLPVAIWAGVIFYASTGRFAAGNTSVIFMACAARLLPQAPRARLLCLHGFARKFGHWAGYFILAFLLARAIELQFPDYSKPTHLGWTAAGISLCAAADESLQTCIPNRHGQLADVVLDICGGLTALALWFWQT